MSVIENGHMTIRQLNKDEICALYPYMEAAFPDDELKPLDAMTDAYDAGAYDCYGLMRNHTIVGYACFVRTGKHLLLDYFSILPEYRNLGLGSEFIKKLDFSNADSVIAEVEYPENEMQQRRLEFYLRNGFVNTGIRVRVFNVDYLLLTLKADGNIREIYRRHYKARLTEESFRQNIII